MSEQHPDGEEIARMLREQGPVQAPPDLADEVMRQVRTEAGPHRSKRRYTFRRPAVLVPALGLAAAAALVVGISHLGNLSSSESSAGGESRAAAAANGGLEKHLDLGNSGHVYRIPARAARSLSTFGVVLAPKATPPPTPSTAVGSSAGSSLTPTGAPVTLTVRGPEWRAARDRLQALALAHARHKSEPSVLVVLRRKP